jgi:hypothetical protein
MPIEFLFCIDFLNNHKRGLMASHAFSILDCFEIPKQISTKTRKTSRLMRVRNPWGWKEWNGKWCDEINELDNNREK